mmetsp:Transcript_18735/g.63486  ORF Transcript_18735/g.63486 Transcript_18735/m.63486 type:complete len:353 (+) Transcript_18735:141-1199(+)
MHTPSRWLHKEPCDMPWLLRITVDVSPRAPAERKASAKGMVHLVQSVLEEPPLLGDEGVVLRDALQGSAVLLHVLPHAQHEAVLEMQQLVIKEGPPQASLAHVVLVIGRHCLLANAAAALMEEGAPREAPQAAAPPKRAPVVAWAVHSHARLEAVVLPAARRAALLRGGLLLGICPGAPVLEVRPGVERVVELVPPGVARQATLSHSHDAPLDNVLRVDQLLVALRLGPRYPHAAEHAPLETLVQVYPSEQLQVQLEAVPVEREACCDARAHLVPPPLVALQQCIHVRVQRGALQDLFLRLLMLFFVALVAVVAAAALVVVAAVALLVLLVHEPLFLAHTPPLARRLAAPEA